MDQEYLSAPFLITNGLAIFLVIWAFLRPTSARVLLSFIFIAAFVFNFYNAIENPDVYLNFASLTSSDFYRRIILGPFRLHIGLYVCLIAMAQGLIGVFTLYRGGLKKIGLFAGMVFFVAISPLGIGAAFPAPLIMVIALSILLYKDRDVNIPDDIRKKLFRMNDHRRTTG